MKKNPYVPKKDLEGVVGMGSTAINNIIAFLKKWLS